MTQTCAFASVTLVILCSLVSCSARDQPTEAQTEIQPSPVSLPNQAAEQDQPNSEPAGEGKAENSLRKEPDEAGPPAGTIQFLLGTDQDAQRAAKALKDIQPGPAKLLELLAQQPSAVWLGDQNSSVEIDAQKLAQAAIEQNRTALLVIQALPHRDCGNYLSRGFVAAAYRTWIQRLAVGLGQAPTFIILEPDALTLNACVKDPDWSEKLRLIQDAVQQLKKNPLARVYLDIGHSAWLSPAEAANRLLAAGVDAADGFALNVANYQSTEDSIRYGQEIRAWLPNKAFVIDTSRNGRGPRGEGEWCNPPGRAIGHLPLAPTGLKGVDAYLWVKRPGESDGTCNGGPPAGQWWQERALDLVRQAQVQL